MTADDFERLSAFLKQRSGFVLAPDKAYLLEARLAPVARKWNLGGVQELAACLRGCRDEALLRDVTEAMTINETSFFRDGRVFQALTGVILPRLLQGPRGRRFIRIWSAACSSGQEVWSLCMALEEAGFREVQFDIVGTDIATRMIARARSGLYTQHEVQRGLPIQHLVRHFDKVGERWQVNARLRSMARFYEHNLLDDPAFLGYFDIVFCRNVLIYFDLPTRRRILDRMAQRMPEDGVLCLGATETTIGITDRFQPLEGLHGLYAPVGARD